MNGEFVATWSEGRGASTLKYQPSWLESPRRRSLSLSLPINETLTIQGARVTNYFDNLLPDNDKIRERMRRRFHAKSNDVIDILTAVGRDCVGAVQLLPPDEEPVGFDKLSYEPLSESRVAHLLRHVTSDGPLAQDADEEDFRISIAGAQEKTALLKVADSWCAPHGATPTTHILKLPAGVIGGRVGMLMTVENEWLCMQLLDALGLPVASTEIANFEEQKALVVTRFDRLWMEEGAWIARLPQEDFCQATATPPDKKYEVDGGPGLEKCMQLLAGSSTPDLDRERFLLGQLAFWMLAATDGHAKNFSIFLERGDAYVSTPFYDVISMWPIIGKEHADLYRGKVKMAMALRSKNAHYVMDGILPRHWEAKADATGIPHMRKSMLLMAHGVEAAIATVAAKLPKEFPARIWDAITDGLRSQSCTFIDSFEPSAPK